MSPAATGRMVSEEGTAAPAAIGAYAAALQALELLKLIGGELPDALVDKEVFIDAGHHRHWVTKFVRNPRCRFDHESWEIKPVAELSVAEALALANPHGGTPALSVEGDGFVTALTCPGCGVRRERSPRLRKRLAERDWICGHCGKRLLVTGFDLLEQLSGSALSAPDLSASLFELGLRPGDLFCVGSGADRCDRFQLELPPAGAGSQGATVVVVGLGNVGSQLAPLAARMPGVGRVVLIDHDSYERKNLRAQAIRAADIGRTKALVQADRLREINPALNLVAIVDRFETVPLGFLRDA
ncbi:MAG: ThiF family adenylyltransferase, partial [Candidatus Binatia bacterium]